ncbi:hypothetical protein G7Y89_g11601 [Cudoniella acicularis]|uniref:Serine carboxypeptidase S28-domain-containing protein n=1 Tax=Cudoniella acicularis TaxID=354080 RepID=A0A8H4RE80_9HELO|nr:hypothetical protein G7Y89_g11601 [Cudoniella acicularis]
MQLVFANTVALQSLYSAVNARHRHGLRKQIILLVSLKLAQQASTTFQNRYYVNAAHYKPGGPVILVDIGEESVDGYGGYVDSGTGEYGLPVALANQFNGLMILWEHRYYGQSFPGTYPTNTSTPDELASYFQYLTVEQALEDVAVFAKNFTLDGHPPEQFLPNNAPWVFVGGSYAGARAAFMRLRNPEVIFASLASSAPVQLQADFWQYFVAIERGLVDFGYQGCLNDIHALATYITGLVANFNVTGAENLLQPTAKGLNYAQTNDNSTDAWNLRKKVLFNLIYDGFSLSHYQASGIQSVASNCPAIQDAALKANSTATVEALENGVVAAFGEDAGISAISSALANIFGGTAKRSISGSTSTSTKMDSNNQPEANWGTSWGWQQCSETVSNDTRSTNMIPGFVDVDYWIATRCVAAYGQAVAAGPNSDPINKKYGGWNMNPTNTLFTNGEFDNWRALSVASDVDASTPGRKLSTTIPSAGQSLPNGQVFAYTITNGSHATEEIDFNHAGQLPANSTEAESVNEAGNLLISALSSWLPAFTPFNATSTSAQTAPPTAIPTGAGLGTNPNGASVSSGSGGSGGSTVGGPAATATSGSTPTQGSGSGPAATTTKPASGAGRSFIAKGGVCAAFVVFGLVVLI